MDKPDLLAALAEVGAILQAECELIIVGGAAMILRFGASRVTRDVDVLLIKGSSTQLREATRQVAEHHHLPEDWLNDSVQRVWQCILI